MKKIVLILTVIFFSGCASLQTPKETNIAVSALLDEIQIAINEIDKRTEGSSLPPFNRAEIRLSTKATKTTAGSASLVLSGDASKSTTNSNIITLELVPSKIMIKNFDRRMGHEIADYVIAAVMAVDDKKALKLKALTVEAGLDVKEKEGGGIDIQLVGVSLKGTHTGEMTMRNSLKLVFSYPARKMQ